MNVFQTSDSLFSGFMKEAKAHILAGDITETVDKLEKAIKVKPTPTLRQFVAIQQLMVRLPPDIMNSFCDKYKTFFSQSQKFLEMDVLDEF